MQYNLPQGLIVSCQATEDEPLFNMNLMHQFARCAKEGGAVAIRALAEEAYTIKKEVGLPVIALTKRVYGDSPIYITSTFEEIDILAETNCDVIAMDATNRIRTRGISLADLVQYARKKLPNVQLMADIATIEEAINAEKLGFEFVSTTLRGYTEETKDKKIPDYDFLAECKKALKKSLLVAEGGIWEVGQLEQILNLKPYAVVIGTAITRPHDITKRFSSIFKRTDNE